MSSQHGESWMNVLPRGAEAGGAEWSLPPIDTTVAHSARRYDYWLGGKDNFAADRESVRLPIAAAFPTVRTRGDREPAVCPRRAAGLPGWGRGDPGSSWTSAPASPPAPERARDRAGDRPGVRGSSTSTTTRSCSRTQRALLAQHRGGGPPPTSTPTCVSPTRSLAMPSCGGSLTFPGRWRSRTPAATLHFIPDEDDPYGIVARLAGALPEGSYLVMSHATNDFLEPQEVAEITAGGTARSSPAARPSSPASSRAPNWCPRGLRRWPGGGPSRALPRPTAARGLHLCAGSPG